METAIAYARRGYAVVLAARRTDRLAEVAQQCKAARRSDDAAPTLVVPTDVALAQQVQELVDRAAGELGRIDVMVNNAGYGLFAQVHQTSIEEMRQIVDVNFMGVFYGCRAAAPIMMRQRSGHIFNVSSVIGKRGTPFHGAYCATKFAIVGLSDAMRVEMKPFGVRVTTVCPALTETEFFDQQPGGAQAKSSFKRFKKTVKARDVGEKIAAATGKKRPEIVFSAGGKALVLISALSPRLADWMMRLYYNDLVKRQDHP